MANHPVPQGLGLNILDMNTFNDPLISSNSSDSSTGCSNGCSQRTSTGIKTLTSRKKSVSWAHTPENDGASTSSNTSLCRMISITQIDQQARLSRREEYGRGGGADADDELDAELEVESLDDEDECGYEVDIDGEWSNSALATELALGTMNYSQNFHLRPESGETGTSTTSIASSNSSCGTGSSSGTSSGNEDDEREDESSGPSRPLRGRRTFTSRCSRSSGTNLQRRQQAKFGKTLPSPGRRSGLKFDEDMLPAKPIKGYFAARVMRVDSFDGGVDELDEVDVEGECDEVWRSWVDEM